LHQGAGDRDASVERISGVLIADPIGNGGFLQIEMLVQSLPRRWRRVLAVFTAGLGMRSGEALSLTWVQVDLMAKRITVGRAKSSNGTGRDPH